MDSYAHVVRPSALTKVFVFSMSGGMLALAACSAVPTNTSNDSCTSGYEPAANNASSCCPLGLPYAADDGYCYESAGAARQFQTLPGRIPTACAGFDFEYASWLNDAAREARDTGYSFAENIQLGTDACIEGFGQDNAARCAACLRAVVEVAYEEAPPDGCNSDADCYDGLFCNGQERCNQAQCSPGSSPCGDDICDEPTASCVRPFISGNVFSFLSPLETEFFNAEVSARVRDIDEWALQEQNRIFFERGGTAPSFDQICLLERSKVELKRAATFDALEATASVRDASGFWPLSFEDIREVERFNCREYPNTSIVRDNSDRGRPDEVCEISLSCR